MSNHASLWTQDGQHPRNCFSIPVPPLLHFANTPLTPPRSAAPPNCPPPRQQYKLTRTFNDPSRLDHHSKSRTKAPPASRPSRHPYLDSQATSPSPCIPRKKTTRRRHNLEDIPPSRRPEEKIDWDKCLQRLVDVKTAAPNSNVRVAQEEVIGGRSLHSNFARERIAFSSSFGTVGMAMAHGNATTKGVEVVEFSDPRACFDDHTEVPVVGAFITSDTPETTPPLSESEVGVQYFEERSGGYDERETGEHRNRRRMRKPNRRYDPEIYVRYDK